VIGDHCFGHVPAFGAGQLAGVDEGPESLDRAALLLSVTSWGLQSGPRQLTGL